MSNTVTVQYNALVNLTGSQIEYNGSPFDCNQCTYGGCCGDATGSNIVAQCYKCGCQSKGNTHCGTSGGCSLCGGHSCDCSDKNSNATIYSSTVSSTVVPCSSAQQYIANSLIIGRVTNTLQVTNQCNPTTKIQCCQGASNLSQDACGPSWGPSDVNGNCDATMDAFCQSNPSDASCACINSDFPIAECQDKRCSNSSAYRTSTMKANHCDGAYLTCIQYDALVSTGEGAYIDSSAINQNCTQNNNPGSSSSSSSSATPSQSTTKTIIIVVAVLGGVLLLAGLATILLSSKKKPGQPVRLVRALG